MAMVKLIGKFEPGDAQPCFMFINTDALSFVTPGPVEDSDGVPYTQLFFHFLGGVESMGFFVPNMAEALVKLGHVE